MTLFDELTIPALIAGTAVLFVVLAVVSRLLRPRPSANPVMDRAAFQVERDVMRANHAVEIAALEGKLAQLRARPLASTPQADARRSVAEEAAGELRKRFEAITQEHAATVARMTALEAERDELAAKVAEGASAAAPADGTRADGDGASAEVDRLTAALKTVAERENLANAQLSRLAYDLDDMRSRVALHERVESEARAEVEKRDALLELRLQKIYALEEQLRQGADQLRNAQERAVAEKEAATSAQERTTVQGALEAKRRVEELEQRLDGVHAQNTTLLGELEALRRHAADAASATPSAGGMAEELTHTRATLAEATQENARLKRAVSRIEGLGEGDVDALRAELHSLASRFLAEAEATPRTAGTAEPSLADRIRAFKAARANADA